jgi:nicotinate-nucleotide--dimethylbenzimidazole phosphoribosyltransferase
MAATALPFDDFRDLVNLVPGVDQAAVDAVRRRDRELTKPAGALGRLEEIVAWLAGWQGKAIPAVNRPLVAIFAANHGVAVHGVSAFPTSVTQAMVENLALEVPTADILTEDAFSEADCAATMAFGMESLAGEPDLLCLGEMGIGNTTVAATIFHALFGGCAEDWVGPGTGVSGEILARKVAVVRAAVARLDGRTDDAFEVLRRLGGREIAAMVGAIIATRHQKIPVVVDGYVTTAAAAIVYAANPAAIDHCLFGHLSAEPAHARALALMGKRPLLDLDMRLGEGTGAALAATLIRSAAAIHSGMATFASARLEGRN